MSIAILITGVILVIVGIILYYFILPKTEESAQKQTIIGNIKKYFPPMIGSIFIFLGIFWIMEFCLGIDGSNFTPETEDDMTILSGIMLALCSLSLESHIAFYLRKFKNNRNK